jgi:hypothetical protein
LFINNIQLWAVLHAVETNKSSAFSENVERDVNSQLDCKDPHQLVSVLLA